MYGASPTAVNVVLVLVGVTCGWALSELGRTAEAEQILAETEAHAREQIGRGSENTAYPLSLAVMAEERGFISPVVGGIVLAAGVVLLLIGRRRT